MGKKRVFNEDDEANEKEITQSDRVEGRNEPENGEVMAVKKQKTKKPLPPGYVCNACKAVDDHAIYDCPLKIKKKYMGKNTEERIHQCIEANNDEVEEREDEVPVDKKEWSLFVSGLPFDANRASFLKFIQKTFEESSPDYRCELTARDIVLLNFPDNQERCNGLGYINCKTESDYEKCLQELNGIQYGKLKLSVAPSAPLSTKKPVSNGTSQKSQHKRKGLANEAEGSTPTRRCYRCGQPHDPKTCTNPRICYRCRSTDHISSNCPRKKQI